eukprot:2268690-Rhodomonas_salina.1
MAGTDAAYGAICLCAYYAKSCAERAYGGTSLCAYYAESGTEIAWYQPATRSAVLRQRMVPAWDWGGGRREKERAREERRERKGEGGRAHASRVVEMEMKK